jgi:FixJ family two-component response regulator
MVARPLISVVDDNESVRESLPDLLNEFGFEAQTFSSAEEFLASESAAVTSCLVLDVAMPGMTGPDLQRELKLRERSIPNCRTPKVGFRCLKVSTDCGVC